MAAGKEYPTEKIRNVAVLGHGGAGKTSLIDALCFTAGTSKRRGNVDEGHVLTMTTPEEYDHGISMQLTPAYADVGGTKLNLLDTPGFLDFSAEMIAAVRVADSALIVVGSTSGVEVGTEKVWEYCRDRGIPRLFYVSMMDKEHANFEQVYRDIKENLTDKVLPVEIPIGEGDDFEGIINLINEKARIYKKGTQTGEYDEVEIPEEYQAKFQEWQTELQETVATVSEDLLDKYLETGHISREETVEAMALAMARGEVYPLFCGSAKLSYGMHALLQEFVELTPSPADVVGEVAQRPGLDQEAHLKYNDEEPFSALIFKTSTEPHVGELSYFKVMSGSVANGAEVKNAQRGVMEKLNHLSIPMGKERVEVSRLHAGDIGVVAKLKDSHTNDTLSSPERLVVLDKFTIPSPDIAMAVRGAARSDEDKLGEVLQKLHEEDPSFVSGYNAELGQTIARGLGEIHLDVMFERMKRKYGVSVETEPPRIAYRETITREAEGQGRFRKQTGGRGQFGDCHVRLRPLPRGEGYNFVDSIKGGVIPTKYIPSVNKGIVEAAAKGILAGYPFVDFEAECFYGSYHTVDSSDIAFKVAGTMAFQKVAQDARPVLLEPIVEVTVTTPEEYVGDIMGDMTSRRGKVQGMEPVGGKSTVRAIVPEAELFKYSAALRSMTQGRAHHTRKLVGYEPMTDLDAKKVIARAKKEKEES